MSLLSLSSICWQHLKVLKLKVGKNVGTRGMGRNTGRGEESQSQMHGGSKPGESESNAASTVAQNWGGSSKYQPRTKCAIFDLSGVRAKELNVWVNILEKEGDVRRGKSGEERCHCGGTKTWASNL
jgi:hypothetical protein